MQNELNSGTGQLKLECARQIERPRTIGLVPGTLEPVGFHRRGTIAEHVRHAACRAAIAWENTQPPQRRTLTCGAADESIQQIGTDAHELQLGLALLTEVAAPGRHTKAGQGRLAAACQHLRTVCDDTGTARLETIGRRVVRDGNAEALTALHGATATLKMLEQNGDADIADAPMYGWALRMRLTGALDDAERIELESNAGSNRITGVQITSAENDAATKWTEILTPLVPEGWKIRTNAGPDPKTERYTVHERGTTTTVEQNPWAETRPTSKRPLWFTGLAAAPATPQAWRAVPAETPRQAALRAAGLLPGRWPYRLSWTAIPLTRSQPRTIDRGELAIGEPGSRAAKEQT